jgi:arabinogalactan oligomer / maltooligosaccharide transport system permease protein
MATMTKERSFQNPVVWQMLPNDSPTSLTIRRTRIVLAGLSFLMALFMLFTNSQNYLTVILFAWLTFTFLVPAHGILIGYCAMTIYPITRSLTIALRPTGNLLQTSLWIIPPNASLGNFQRLFANTDFLLWLWNSLTISLAVSFVGVAVSATSAYAFSRYRFPGRAPGLLLLLTTQMLPAGMLLIPLYIIVINLKMQNNILGLVLAYTATAVPFSIWILKGYYDTIPYDLEEAALVDGASRLEAFIRLVLPISTPALMTVFLFNFQSAWSEWQVANIIMTSPNNYTWPIGLKNLIGQFQTDWGTYAAASLLVAIPVMILFMYSSKYVISGLTLGSVKG